MGGDLKESVLKNFIVWVGTITSDEVIIVALMPCGHSRQYRTRYVLEWMEE